MSIFYANPSEMLLPEKQRTPHVLEFLHFCKQKFLTNLKILTAAGNTQEIFRSAVINLFVKCNFIMSEFFSTLSTVFIHYLVTSSPISTLH